LKPWRPGLLACALIAFFGIVYASVAHFALHDFPFSGDEYSAFLQAEIFSRGLLHTVAPTPARYFWVDHVIVDGIVCSKYPLGTSALLAIGVRLGIPSLVNPTEGVVTLGLVWATVRREFGDRAALVSVVTLGGAPLFIFHSATFFSHAPTTMFLAAALYCVSRWGHGQRDTWLVGAGAALGLAFLTRPFDAFVLGASLLALRSRRVLLFTALGGAPFAVVHLLYQSAQFGGAFHDGYHAYQPEFAEIYGASTAANNFSLAHLLSAEQQFYHLDIARSFLVDWTFPLSALVAVFGARSIGRGHPARGLRDVLLALVAVTFSFLLCMFADPDDGARPRYVSSALLTVAVLAGPGWAVVHDQLISMVGLPVTRALVVIALAIAPIQVGSYLVQRLPLQWVREGLYTAVRDAGIESGLVIVRAAYPTRYARNGPFFDRPVRYLSVPNETSVDAVARTFGDVPIYEATEGTPWTLVRRR
jgi:4-amino-4-deoxy-L-arabinose transferase-like glycosyltransferase